MADLSTCLLFLLFFLRPRLPESNSKQYKTLREIPDVASFKARYRREKAPT